MNLMELILGQIPEAIYFALFMIFTKELKEKRVIFSILMIIEYILLLNVFPFSTWSHVLYFIISYIIMKMLYKEKCQIIDVFTLGISSLLLIASSFITYMIIWFTIDNFVLAAIIQKLILFIVLFICKPYLPNIQKLYKYLWNRSNNKKIVKSATFRASNVVVFNTMFVIINLGMLFMLTQVGGD